MSRPALAPFRSPAYRRFFGAWTLTQTGVWVYYTAMTWTVLQNVGTAAAVAFLPLVYVAPVPIAIVASGFLTDRRGPRFTLALSELGLGAGLLLGAGLAAAGVLSFGPTLLVGAIVGTSVGLAQVPSQALIVRLVDQRDAAGAYGASLLTTGLARIVGGPLGGAVLAVAGPAAAFLVAAAMTAFALGLVASVPHTPGLAPTALRSPLLDAGRAVRWASRARAALLMISLDAILAAFIFPYLALMPVVARDLVGGSSADLGLLIAAGGVGVLGGAVVVGPLGRALGQGRLLVVVLLAAAVGIAGLALSSSLPVSALLAGLVAAATNGFGVTEGLLLQTMTPSAIRGRVLALDGVVASVANPLGILVVGLLAQTLGPRPVLLAMAGVGVGGLVIVVAVRRRVVELDVDEGGALVDARRAVRAEEPLADAPAVIPVDDSSAGLAAKEAAQS